MAEFEDNTDMEPKSKSTAVKLSRSTARNPWKVLIGAVVATVVLSAIGLTVGNFSVAVDNEGWRSRGTVIANREMQADVMNLNVKQLFEDEDGSHWEYLKTVVTEGYVDLEERDDAYDRRLTHSLSSDRHADKVRSLAADTCDASFYQDYEEMYWTDNVFAVWKVQPDLATASLSALDNEVMSQICEAEIITLQVMQENGSCETCSNGKCVPPHSLVFLLRDRLSGHEMSCEDLMVAYTSDVQNDFTNELVTCNNDLVANYDSLSQTFSEYPTSCPFGYLPNLVDPTFGKNDNIKIRYTSSYFNVKDVDEAYKVYTQFGGADGVTVRGVYDTYSETFNGFYADELIVSDMILAVASLTITFTAMLIHTKSLWLTFVGILQIVLAIPLSYFFYSLVAGLNFFPFLNFIGVFVAAALGADDLFVAVDKWKNARIRNPKGSTEDIAEVALPDAASAMILTTSTTAVAFFATCICPVPPILCFAVFCGLMIMFNYLLNVLFVFPALCLYDTWLQNGSKNCLVVMCAQKTVEDDVLDSMEDADPDKPVKMSLIHRILSNYYNLIHRFHWPVLAASLVAIGVCIYYAFTLPLPANTDVRLLPEGHPLELHFTWQTNLLSAVLFATGTQTQIIFGLKAGDTGVQNDPGTLSTLLLDTTFNPSSEETQTYLRDFCDRLFDTEFCNKRSPDYVCAINMFDSWLKDQSTSTEPTAAYTDACNGGTALPLPAEDFDACIIAWSKSTNNMDVLQENGKVRILTVDARASILFSSPIATIDDEWNRFEAFFKTEKLTAPADAGVDFMHVSPMWWWFDTNTQMLNTALGAAAIAIAFSAVIVLISSRSLILTLFSGACIIYVLAAATASLVGLGWELGFLESVCFAILVGISCDFVIHFGHAYIHHKGKVDKQVRTKYAVIHMGPSILAAALTTMSAAVVMLFCKITFFTKFAMILLMTILHATIGSFVVYIVLNDLFGPSEPTRMIDRLIARITGKKTDTVIEEIEPEQEKSTVEPEQEKSTAPEEYDLK